MSEPNYHTKILRHISNRNEKNITTYEENSLSRSIISILKINKIVMYQFWYD